MLNFWAKKLLVKIRIVLMNWSNEVYQKFYIWNNDSRFLSYNCPVGFMVWRGGWLATIAKQNNFLELEKKVREDEEILLKLRAEARSTRGP